MSKRPIYYKGIKLGALGLPASVTESTKAKETHRKRAFYNATFHSTFKKNAVKDLIVMYDVPHNMKRERDWLRRQLMNLDYVMIQKSVWIGPSPLPKDFTDYVRAIGLKDKLKTFKIDKLESKKKRS